MSVKPSAPLTCWPASTLTNCVTGPRSPNGKSVTASCCPPATTQSGSTPHWPRQASSVVDELESYGCDDSRAADVGNGLLHTGNGDLRWISWPRHLTVAVGIALGLRHQGSTSKVINFLSDGELGRGSRRGKPRWAQAITGSAI